MNERDLPDVSASGSRRTGGRAALVICALIHLAIAGYLAYWWQPYLHPLGPGVEETKAVTSTRPFVPAEIVIGLAVVAFVAAAALSHLSAYLFGMVASGGFAYTGLSVAMADRSHILAAYPQPYLLACAHAVGVLASVLLLPRAYSRQTKLIQSMSASLPEHPFATLLLILLGAYIPLLWVLWRLHVSPTLVVLLLKIFLLPDLLVLLLIGASFATLGEARREGYLLGFIAVGTLLCRAAFVTDAVRLQLLGTHPATKAMGIPYEVASLLILLGYWSEFRRDVERRATTDGGSAIGLSTKPILPAFVHEALHALRLRIEAIGVVGMAMEAWRALVWRVLWKGDETDTWSTLIGGAQGRADSLLAHAEALIVATKAPDVRMERKRVAPGIIRGIFGVRRDFLVLTQDSNPRLRPFQLFLGARDYGLALDIYWYLTYRPTWRDRLWLLIALIPGVNLLLLPVLALKLLSALVRERRVSLNLDLFDESDLRAYVTNAHHCIMKAVDKLLGDLNIDPSKVDRKSRGFLGISG